MPDLVGVSSALAQRRVQPASNSQHAVNLRFVDASGSPTLHYSEHDRTGAMMRLEITNLLNQNLTFAALGKAPSHTAHHFVLQFRPGSLDSHQLGHLKIQEKGYQLQAVAEPAATKVYLLATGNQTLNAHETLTLTFPHVRADTEQGSHNTRVICSYQNLKLGPQPLRGTQEQILSITNKVHDKPIQMIRAGFAGSNVVVNDHHTKTSLVVELTNVSPNQLISLSDKSEIEISFDVQGEKENKKWALCTHGVTQSIAPTVVLNTDTSLIDLSKDKIDLPVQATTYRQLEETITQVAGRLNVSVEKLLKQNLQNSQLLAGLPQPLQFSNYSYTLQATETLTQAAKKLTFDPAVVAQANVKAKQSLTLPAGAWVAPDGEWVASLAAKYKTDPRKLTAANIKAGQHLKLPPGFRYAVKSNDTLDSIAAMFGIANPAAILDRHSNSGISGHWSLPTGYTYPVKPGETMKTIATRFDVNLADLVAANLQAGDRIELPRGARFRCNAEDSFADIGWKLGLPWGDLVFARADSSTHQLKLPADYRYVVKAGDTLKKIAAGFAITPMQLAAANFAPGLKLRLPDHFQIVVRKDEKGDLIAARLGLDPSQLTKSTSGSHATFTPHPGFQLTVQPGDTLDSILIRLGISDENQLYGPNQRTLDALVPGQRLCLPPNAHITKPRRRGSVWTRQSITREYQIAWERIAEANAELSQNESLPLPRDYQYTVKPGDSLAAIAALFGLTPDDLLRVNAALLKTMLARQRLQMPASQVKKTHGVSAARKSAQLGISLQTLFATNFPTGTKIELPPSAYREVKPGETLESIVSNLGDTIEAWLNSNLQMDRAGIAVAWKNMAQMNTARAGHRATRLRNGMVFVMGGDFGPNMDHVPDSIELFDPAANRWKWVGGVTWANAETATLMPDDRVIVTGGHDTSSDAYQSDVHRCETSLAKLGEATQLASMNLPRAGHTATLLHDGTLLVVGGENQDQHAISSCELLSVDGKTWTSRANLNVGRVHHTATLLDDGRVLVVGGQDRSKPIASVEIYDPHQDKWTMGPQLPHAREFHTATKLPSGAVVVSGGKGNQQPLLILDSGADKWRTLSTKKVSARGRR